MNLSNRIFSEEYYFSGDYMSRRTAVFFVFTFASLILHSCSENPVDEGKLKVFTLDENTLALYHFNEDSGSILLDETGRWNGTLDSSVRSTTGFAGKCLSLSTGKFSTFGTIIPDNTPNGTIELYFSFDPDSVNTGNHILIGNDGARCNILYKGDTLYFLKNHSNFTKYVKALASVQKGKWHHVAGTWGSKGMRLFLNGVCINSNQDTSSYQMSPRSTAENVFFIGKKSRVGLNEIGINQSMHFNGKIDEIRISDIERY